MTKEKIPLVYKIVLKRLWANSELGRIRYRSARVCLNTLRLGSDNSMDILKELKNFGYIECIGPHTIVMKIDLKDLV